MLLFPGDRLHGVCPCAPRESGEDGEHGDGGGGGDAGGGDEGGGAKRRRGGRPAPLRRAAAMPRRVTLMIGFWTRDVGRRARPAAARHASSALPPPSVPPAPSTPSALLYTLTLLD